MTNLLENVDLSVSKDNRTYDVSIGTIMGEVTVDGNTIPTSKVWDAALKGLSLETIGETAVNAATYRMDPRTVIVVTGGVPAKSTAVLSEHTMTNSNGVTTFYWVARVEEEMRIKPWMPENGIMARLEVQPSQPVLVALFTTMCAQGYAPVGIADDKIFFVPTTDVASTLREYGVSVDDVRNNAHILVRLGVLMKRPGGVMQTLPLPECRFDESENDGTVLISSQLSGPMAGTMRVGTGGTTLFYKGMVRPPLGDGYQAEADCLCSDAQFGKDTPNDAQMGEFSAVRTLEHERCGHNLQEIMFGAKDPAHVLRADNKRFQNMGVEDLFHGEDLRKIRAGVPPSLLMRKYAPWKWLTQLQCTNGVRATVFGSNLVQTGKVMMLPRTYRDFVGPEGEEPDSAPKLVALHRDPALPDASSTHLYELAGVLEWSNGLDSSEAEGIVVNPQDLNWKAAGGDFDGDAAVAYQPAFDLADQAIGDVASWVVKQKTKGAVVRGELRTGATIARTATQFGSRLGPAALCSMRLAEVNRLEPETRVLASQVMQTAVSSKKHPVNSRRGEAAYSELRALNEQHEPECGYWIDMIQQVKKAPGDARKSAAWKSLVEHVTTVDPISAIQRALGERVVALNAVFEKTEWLRNNRAQLSEEIRSNALAWMMDEDDAAQQMELVRNLSTAYRQAVRAIGESSTEEGRDIAAEVAESFRVQFRMHMAIGSMSEAALVAYGPHALAAELVSADTFEELGGEKQFAEMVMYGADWSDGEIDARWLDTIPSHDNRLEAILDAGVEVVNLKVLRRNASSTKVLLTW